MSDPFVEAVLDCVRREIEGSRAKWPGNEDKLAAFAEEAGELHRAMLRHKHEQGGPADVFNEAVQAAASAVRLAIEGDAGFPYRCSLDFPGAFRPTCGETPKGDQ